ncbi:MAG TPA: hypothetical protein VMZ28_22775 [Kofleriaceae bacterium]|nr:hypothetical protein [Kofleriaceae bacterium]
MNDREIKDALQRIDPGAAPADLADRAFRRAMAAGRAVTFAERFAGAGRRLVLGAAAVAVAVWIGVLLRPAEDPAASAAIEGDPIDAALVVWAGEAAEDTP